MLVIFDLDGVLLESRNLHYRTLNAALMANGLPPVSHEVHLSTLDGLPTRRKLEILDVPVPIREHIWRDKQAATQAALQELKSDEHLVGLFKNLRDRGIKIAVASNAVEDTVSLALQNLGLAAYVDRQVSTITTAKAKPSPAMYWWVMEKLNETALTTLIVEDSHIGRQAALASGAKLLPVTGPEEVTLERILSALPRSIESVPWRQPELNVVIPMAGEGRRFVEAGYTFPKPLIEIHEKPMIQHVLESLHIEAQYILLAKSDHVLRLGLVGLVNRIAPGAVIRSIYEPTEGALSTVLMAEHLIDNDQPLLIANSDQIIEWNANEVMYAFNAKGIDGGIVTFKASHPKWSYVRLGPEGFVAEVAEKRVISDTATVGIYFWKRGSDFVKYAKQMIAADERVNGEFYIAPVYNRAITDGLKIRVKSADKMWGLGDPESLEEYLRRNP